MYCPDCHAVLSSDYVCPRCGFSLRRGGTGGSKLAEGQEPPRATVDLTRRRSKQSKSQSRWKKIGELRIDGMQTGKTIDGDAFKHYQWLGAKLIIGEDSGITANATDEQIGKCFRALLGVMRAPVLSGCTLCNDELLKMVEANGIRPTDENLREELKASERAVVNAAQVGKVDASLQMLHVALFFWINCMGNEKRSEVAKELHVFEHHIGDLDQKAYGPSIALMACALWATDYQEYRRKVRELCEQQKAICGLDETTM